MTVLIVIFFFEVFDYCITSFFSEYQPDTITKSCLFSNEFCLLSFRFHNILVSFVFQEFDNSLHSTWTFRTLKDLRTHNITIFLCGLHTILFGVSLFQDWCKLSIKKATLYRAAPNYFPSCSRLSLLFFLP